MKQKIKNGCYQKVIDDLKKTIYKFLKEQNDTSEQDLSSNIEQINELVLGLEENNLLDIDDIDDEDIEQLEEQSVSNDELFKKLQTNNTLSTNGILNYEFIRRIYDVFILNKLGNSFMTGQKKTPDKYIPKVQKDGKNVVYLRVFTDSKDREKRQMQLQSLLDFINDILGEKQSKVYIYGLRPINDTSSSIPSLNKMKKEMDDFLKKQCDILSIEYDENYYLNGISLKDFYDTFITVNSNDSEVVKRQKNEVKNIFKMGYIGVQLLDTTSNNYVQILLKPQTQGQGTKFQNYDEIRVQLLVKLVLELLNKNVLTHSSLSSTRKQQIEIYNMLKNETVFSSNELVEFVKSLGNNVGKVKVYQDTKQINSFLEESSVNELQDVDFEQFVDLITGYSPKSERQIVLERQVQLVYSINPDSIKNIDIVSHESQDLMSQIKQKIGQIFKEQNVTFNKDKWNPMDIQLCNSKKLNDLLSVNINEQREQNLLLIEKVNKRFDIVRKGDFYYNEYDFYGVSLKKISEEGLTEQRHGKQSPESSFSILLEPKEMGITKEYKRIHDEMLKDLERIYQKVKKEKQYLTDQEIQEYLKDNIPEEEESLFEDVINILQNELMNTNSYKNFVNLILEQDEQLYENGVKVKSINNINLKDGRFKYILGDFSTDVENELLNMDLQKLNINQLFTPNLIQMLLLKEIVVYGGKPLSPNDPQKKTLQGLLQLMQVQGQIIQQKWFQEKMKGNPIFSDYLENLKKITEQQGSEISVEFQGQWDYLFRTQESSVMWSQNHLKIIGEQTNVTVKLVEFNEYEQFLLNGLEINTINMNNTFNFVHYKIRNSEVKKIGVQKMVQRFFNIFKDFTYEIDLLEQINYKRWLLNEGITHIDDLEVSEFIKWVRDIIYNNEPLLQTIKFDGVQNINMVYKDGKMYQQRITKGKTELIDDPYQWGKSPLYNGLITQTQFILEFYEKHKDIFNKYFKGKGEYIFDCEVVSPWFQNTIEYDFDTGVVVLYRPLGKNFSRELFEQISSELQKQPPLKVTNYIYVINEETMKVERKLFESEWKFKEDEVIDLGKYITKDQREHVENELNKLEQFLNSKPFKDVDLTQYEIMKYKGIDSKIKNYKQTVIDKQSEYVKGIKGLLMKYLNKKIEEEKGSDIEGIVFRKGQELVKLVDKEFFRKLNEFYWRYIDVLDRGFIDRETGEHFDGIMKELKKQQSKLLDFDLLKRGLKKEILNLNGETTDEKLQNFLTQHPELVEKQDGIKDELIKLLNNTYEQLKELLNDLTERYKKGELKIKIEKTYGGEKEYKYTQSVYNRTKEQILLKIKLLKELIEGIEKVEDDGVQVLFVFLKYVLFYGE